MSEERVGPRVAVVGGGISGLAAAWFLRQALGAPVEITVFEQRDVVGGHLRVSEVAGVPVDEGAESLLARRPEAVELARACGLATAIVEPAPASAGIWSRGEIHPMPAGTVMGVPEDPASLAGLLTGDELADAVHRDRPGTAGMPIDDDVPVGRLVAGRMGQAVADRLVEPLLGGVYAGRADELSLDATVPALGAAARQQATLGAAVSSVRQQGNSPRHNSQQDNGPSSSVRGGAAFAGLDGGVGRLPAAVAQESGAQLYLGAAVRELHWTDAGWRLVTGPVPARQTYRADAVVLAVPPAPAARLLRSIAGVPPAQRAAAELATVEAASMAIVTLALPRTAFPRSPVSSGFLVPPVDGRTVKAVTFSSVKWPWLRERAGDLVLLRASVGRHRQAGELQREDTELVDAVLAELNAAVGVTGPPVDARVTRWGGALPQFAVGHLGRVRRIHDAVAGVPGLAVCGAVYQGVGVAACVAEARQAAERAADAVRAGHVRIET